jgi:U4/U6 small nuclear ribonucleoprotein PRP4
MALQGHVKSILSLDWSPNGYQVATGSEDNSIRIWDIRSPGEAIVIPAHKNIVSQVRFFKASIDFGSGKDTPYQIPDLEALDMDLSHDIEPLDQDTFIQRQVLNGSYLISSSYDATCKIWTDGDWKAIKTLTGLEGKIMCCDVSSDGKFIATAAYDRTFKLHAAE